MELNVVWFVLIAVLFTGFFILEGFDYGVGILLPFVDDDDRTLLLRSIAPVWDGNEVWMITAGGALFAAFPHVYATMFSTFYLALFLMLFALILRGVAFELRGKHDSLCWKRAWDAAIFIGSALPAFLWGVAVWNLLAGLPINGNMTYAGGFFDLLSVYTILGGVVFLLVFAFHGAAFLSLRLVDKSLVERLFGMAKKIGAAAIVAFVIFMLMTASRTDLFASGVAAAAFLLAAAAFVAGYAALMKASGKTCFALSSLAIACTVVALFAGLFPRLMVSSINPAFSLTITNAASTPYTLKIMTAAAACLVPVVLVYQGVTYWIFRKRVSADGGDAH